MPFFQKELKSPAMTMKRKALFVRILVFLTSNTQAIQSISSSDDHVQKHQREMRRNLRSSSTSNVFINDDSSSILHSTRIVGGSDVRQNRFPYYVLLRDDTKLCGGALIAPDVVVTAAHCTGKLWAEVGRTELRNPSDEFESFSIVAEHPHPYYSNIGKLFDRALLKLSGPSSNPVVYVNQNSTFPPNDVGRFNLTTVGFGTVTTDGNFLPANLQEANLEYIPNEVCSQKKTDEIEYDGLIERDMLCAGDDDVGVCHGDSGGPIVASEDAGDILVGLVSWGISPCGALPGVFSRISEDYEWLRDTVCEISDYPPSEFECPPKVSNQSDIPSDGPSLVPSLVPSDAPSYMPTSLSVDTDNTMDETTLTPPTVSDPAPSRAPSPEISHPVWTQSLELPKNDTTRNGTSSSAAAGAGGKIGWSSLCMHLYIWSGLVWATMLLI